MHNWGDFLKVSTGKVKPYELIQRHKCATVRDHQVMNEDGHLDKVRKDSIGAKYLKTKKSERFGESSIFVVETSVAKHKYSRVIEAKGKEFK